MMNSSSNLIFQMAAAWDVFFTRRLPSFLYGKKGEIDTIDGKPAKALMLLPLVGGLVGLFLAVPIWIVGLFGRAVAAALLGGIIVPLIVEILTNGRDGKALSLFLEARRKGKSVEEALTPAKTTKTGDIAGATPSFLLKFSLYLFRMLMFGILAYFNAAFWYIVIFACSFYMRAELSSLNEPGGFGKGTFLPFPYETRKAHIYITLVICILAGLLWEIPFTLIGFGIAALLTWLAKGVCLDAISGINKFAIRVFAYGLEIAMLFLGVLFYAKTM